MRPDTLSVILRSASFIALFQAAGMAMFLAMFGRPLRAARAPLRRLTQLSATVAIALLVGQYALEAARMADAMAGMMDPALQMLALHSATSAVLAVRIAGLAVIVLAAGRGGDLGLAGGVIGAGVIATSFLVTGHTVAHPMRWLLAPLLTFHVASVAFWFGALLPLYVVCGRETAPLAGQVTQAFSRAALWLVPGILAAGVALATVLIRHVAEFRTGYGLSLLAKFSGFSVLMGLAALNKLRLAPALAAGDARIAQAFRRSLAWEYGLIAAVLSITAIMTTFYSPEP